MVSLVVGFQCFYLKIAEVLSTDGERSCLYNCAKQKGTWMATKRGVLDGCLQEQRVNMAVGKAGGFLGQKRNLRLLQLPGMASTCMMGSKCPLMIQLHSHDKSRIQVHTNLQVHCHDQSALTWPRMRVNWDRESALGSQGCTCFLGVHFYHLSAVGSWECTWWEMARYKCTTLTKCTPMSQCTRRI